jgi:peptide deformylase
MDHLNGKLFVDYLSPLKRQRLKKKLIKARKRDGSDAAAARAPSF